MLRRFKVTGVICPDDTGKCGRRKTRRQIVMYFFFKRFSDSILMYIPDLFDRYM